MIKGEAAGEPAERFAEIAEATRERVGGRSEREDAGAREPGCDATAEELYR